MFHLSPLANDILKYISIYNYAYKVGINEVLEFHFVWLYLAYFETYTIQNLSSTFLYQHLV